MSKRDVPAVSENTEGRPWFEWSVAGLVILSAVLAFFGLVAAATIILASTSIVCASLRVSLRGRSPWKVRSVAFDTFIGYAFGIGLIVTYVSILLIA